MIVYRVENQDGKGSYNEIPYSWASEPHTVKTGRPSPIMDIPGWDRMTDAQRKPYVFGFSSLNQLHAWFTMSEIEELSKWGFAVVSVHVDPANIIHGDKQVAFKYG